MQIEDNSVDTTKCKIPFIIHQSWKTKDLTTYADGKSYIQILNICFGLMMI